MTRIGTRHGPTPQSLRLLYARVREYHAARPWDVLGDTDVFGVEDPDTGAVAWCSVLGAAGELVGLAVYEGPEGFALYQGIMSDAVSAEDIRMTQRGFLLSFGARKLLERPEIEVLRSEAGHAPSRDAWPMVRVLSPGYVPSLPDEAACRRLPIILGQVLAVAASVRDTKAELAPDDEGRFLVRRREGAGDDSWASVRVKPAEAARPDVPGFRDELRLRRVARLPQSRAVTWECDYGFAPIVVTNGEDRAAYAAVMLIVDHASGVVLHAKLGPPPLDAAFLQEEFIAAIESARARPQTVLTRTAGVLAMLAPLASAARFDIRGPAGVPALEQARATLVEHMTRRQ